MNIADNPTNVQLPGSYDSEPIQRIPIIVTGNDFSTLYAPLIRDGRMEKFYWEPNRDDRIGIVSGIFQVDAIARADIETLVDAFPTQSIDFFGAVRSRLYDEQVQKLIQDVGLERISSRVVNSAEAPPEFRKPDFSVAHLIEVGNQMVQEQKRIQEMRLAEEYNKSLYFNRKLGDTSDRAAASQETSAAPAQFYRAYEEPDLPATPHSTRSNGQSASATAAPTAARSTSSYAGQPSSTKLTPELVTEANRILGQGLRLGIEYVDARRFRTNSWNSYGSFQGNGAEAIAALETCLTEHSKDYVRLVGIDPNGRRRVAETMIHRPNGKAAS